MAASKTDLFEKELQQRANVFKALAHPARLQILLYLAKSRRCITGDISDHFPISRGTVNQHMKELKESGLIVGHKEASKVVYCLHIEKIKELEQLLQGFMEEIQIPADFSCCL